MQLIAYLFSLAGVFAPQWPTLAQELARYRVPVSAEIGDAARQITSYAVLDDESWFAIAYYWNDGSNTLPSTVHLRTYEKATKNWRYRALQNELGSIVGIRRSADWWYVTGHYTPSAAPTLVLSWELAPVRILKGWPELVLPDGRMIYHHSMVHFAPVHSGSLGLYDPATDRDLRLFPSQESSKTDDLTNRSIEDVKLAQPPATIVFVVVEQQVRLTPNNTAEPVGPTRRRLMTCDVTREPSCVARVESDRR